MERQMDREVRWSEQGYTNQITKSLTEAILQDELDPEVLQNIRAAHLLLVAKVGEPAGLDKDEQD